MVQPPTACLPPIANIATVTTSAQLFDALQYLRTLYLPQVRGSRRRPCLDGDGDQLVQSDPFERAYAIRWLTALIVQLEARQNSPPSTTPETDRLIQQAASLLAACAGVAAAAKVQRQFTFQSILAGEICVTLTDIPLDNHDYASVGAQTWGGACVLAEMIAEHPDRFGLASVCRTGNDGPGGTPSHTHHRSLRVLELGAGTGLVGLTVAKLLRALPPGPHSTLHHRATIVLTDFYPAVLKNLQSNIDANFPDDAGFVFGHPLDWSLFPTSETVPDILSAPFDIVFGADIVYEAKHAVWIRDCLKSLLSLPDGPNEDPVFHLMIPLRPTHAFESGTVEEVFGPKDRIPPWNLTILSKEFIVCEAYTDGSSRRNHADDDVEYVYYRIGWTQ